MKIVVNVEKKYVYGFLLVVSLLGGALVMGQTGFTPDEFGHSYEELDFEGKITSGDVKDGSITANDIKKTGSGLVELYVLRASSADRLNNKAENELNFDYGKCVFAVESCSSGESSGCPVGYRSQFDGFQSSGGFQFNGLAKSYDGKVCSSGFMTICCKN